MRAFWIAFATIGVGVGLVGWRIGAGADESSPTGHAKPVPSQPPASPAPPADGHGVSPAAIAHAAAALGDIRLLPRPLQRALTEPGVFLPMPKPGPSDWLANHEEEGQTFDEFKSGRRHPVTRERKTIRLVALDDLAVGLNPSLDLLVEGVGAFYGLPVVVHKAAAVPKFPTRVGPLGTPQFLTDDVMRWLKTEVPSDTYCLVALTRTDLYPDPAWNFVFGVGSFVERTGVFSFARYDLDPLGKDAPDATVKERRALLLRRSMKVLTHELGHLFGMEHCIEHACLMNGCNSLREMDGQPAYLCPVCLRKVMDTSKGKVEARYAAIEAFDRREGLVAEADWYRARLDYVLKQK